MVPWGYFFVFILEILIGIQVQVVGEILKTHVAENFRCKVGMSRQSRKRRPGSKEPQSAWAKNNIIEDVKFTLHNYKVNFQHLPWDPRSAKEGKQWRGLSGQRKEAILNVLSQCVNLRTDS